MRGRVRRQATNRGADAAPPVVGEVVRAPGQQLDAQTLSTMEARFGHDFSGVRVHADAQAAKSAEAMAARAYTFGEHVVFGAGEYGPRSVAGQRLLAHELTHVVQQSVTKPVVARQPAPQLRPPEIPRPPVRTPPSLRVIEGGLSEATRRSASRTGWRLFWRAVARRFALRGAIAAALSAADGPLPIGELISIGLALWTIWEIVQLWDVLWAEAERLEQEPVAEPESAPQPQPQPQPERERDPREECRQIHPYALTCYDRRTREQVVQSFLVSQGYLPSDLGPCRGMSSFAPGAIDACDGAPGERWHCRVRGTSHEVSVFGCLCCDADGTTSHEWRAPHWSINLSRRGGRR